MATKRMLVDATHPEETRIVVTSGNKLEEFDFESAERRQLRGNIYLAKVTRVEPSLQAAFVEYGGNRHGFLAFSEIHPDYYQIPVADREALMRAEEEAQQHEAEIEDTDAPRNGIGDSEDDPADTNGEDEANGETDGKKVEQLGEGDALEDLQERPRRNLRKYKIQEVIKRRQVLLVQVVKEERGNKGAALTTYLSLAGRYSVLMPNTARGGGISRKITSATDRKRLKEIATGLEVPAGMGVILRTAGASRTKAEVKRDFEYLMRLWENVRTLTLESQAPCLVYEEGSLIKRTIRDLYNKDISEVLVAGDAAYREAKDFMRMIMPSHSKNVQAYKDDVPVFSRYNIESQLDSMFHPQVTLPSGGYIVINPTEALVSIDVNSGRATKEHNIEDTALQTNLEAAEEISRQLRLRDLAGLIVIDFIDMEERRNNRAVEKKLKDCLKHDRARIQVGHISHFGLMEMSRQRIRFGVLESSTHTCPTCAGTGLVRSVSSLALMIMRAIEDHVLRKPGVSINVNVPTEVALYILNSKRDILVGLESRYGLSITISAAPGLVGTQFNIERGETRTPPADIQAAHVRADSGSFDAYDEAVAEEETEEETQEHEQLREDSSSRSKRRRRRKRGNSESQSSQKPVAAKSEDAADEEAPEHAVTFDTDDDDQPKKRRRRGRRGGRRNKRGTEGTTEAANAETGEDALSDADAMSAVEERQVGKASAQDTPDSDAAPEVQIVQDAETEEKPKRARRPRKSSKTKAAEAETPTDAVAQESVEAASSETEKVAEAEEKSARKPRKRTPRKKSEDTSADAQSGETQSTSPASKTADAQESEPQAKEHPEPNDEIVVSSSAKEDGEVESKPKKGWWQRRLGLG